MSEVLPMPTRPTGIAPGDLLVYLGTPLAEIPKGWQKEEETGVVWRRAMPGDENDPNLRPLRHRGR